MAVRTYADDYSTQWGKVLVPGNLPASPLLQPDDGGQERYFVFEHTQGGTAGDATSTQGLFVLPAGRWRPLMASINNSAFGASRTLDIGFVAGTKHDGSALTADPDAFVAAKDVSAALVAWGFNVATWLTGGVIDTKYPLRIISTVAGGTIPAAATLKGWISFGRAV